MNKSRYLKLLAIVEEDYKPVTGEVTFEDGSWRCENVLTIKLNPDFSPTTSVSVIDEFIDGVLVVAKGRSDD